MLVRIQSWAQKVEAENFSLFHYFQFLKKIYLHTLSVLRSGEKKKFLSLIFFSLLISLADIFSLTALLFVIKFYTDISFSFNFSFLPSWLVDRQSVLPVTVLLAVFIVKNVAGFLVYKAQYRFVYGVASRISGANLLQYLEGSYSDYVHTDSAVHIRKISQQPIEFAHYVLSGVQQIITEAILIAIAMIAILLYNVKLFLLLSAIFTPAALLLSWFSRQRLIQARAHIKTINEQTLQYLKEAIAGYIESNIYDKEAFFSERYSPSQQSLNRYLADLHVTQGLPSRMFEVFALCGLFVLIVINKLFGSEAYVDIITIGAFMAAAYKIIPGVIKIINLGGQVKTYSFTVHDLVNNVKSPKKESPERTDEPLHSISLRNISFSYKHEPVLSNFNLSIQKGDFIGISGKSGIGKTTIIHLLLGFLLQDAGEIIINDNLTDADTRKKYWREIAYLKQQPFLIHDSVVKNITLDENDYDELKLEQILHASGLAEMIRTFPEAMHAIIKENGKNISGGQRQRIAFARALYKDAELIILDEPFSELDILAERQLLDCCKQLSQSGKIIILITHNKENLSYCTKVILLDE